MPTTVQSGRIGEETAERYLQKLGYKILTRNFHSRFGEIDIVAIDPSAGSGQAILVFIEVKTRWSRKFGTPQEAVTPWKIRAIIKTGEYYKVLNPKTPDSLRIDVLAIVVEGNTVTSLEHIKNVSQ